MGGAIGPVTMMEGSELAVPDDVLIRVSGGGGIIGGLDSSEVSVGADPTGAWDAADVGEFLKDPAAESRAVELSWEGAENTDLVIVRVTVGG